MACLIFLPHIFMLAWLPFLLFSSHFGRPYIPVMAAAFTVSVLPLVCVTFVYAVKLSLSWNYSQHQPLAREEQRTKKETKFVFVWR